MRAEREVHIQRAVLQYLRMVRRWPCVRVNCGAVCVMQGGRKRLLRFNDLAGVSDVLAILPPEGRLASIEVKRPGNKPTADQLAWLDQVRQAGGLALVVTSVQDLVDQLEGAGY